MITIEKLLILHLIAFIPGLSKRLVSIDNTTRNNHFYYFIKFIMLQQKNDIDYINVRFMPLTGNC